MQQLHKYLESNLPRYMEFLKELVSINSFTSNQQGVNHTAEIIAHKFSNLGFQAEFVPSINPKFGNHLFLTRSQQPPKNKINGTATTKPGFVLVSHLDTVYSPEEENQNNFIWRKQGDRIYGPGTVDIKGGTVVIFMVLEALKAHYPAIFESTPWLIALNASEEVLSEDFSQHILERLPQPTRACLVFEGGTPSPEGITLVIARKGRATFRITVQGKSAHAGNYHRLGANAIVQIAHTIIKIAGFTDYDKRLTFNVGKVLGGTVVNRVPHYAETEVEMRCFEPEIFDQGVLKIQNLDGDSQVTSQDGFICKVSVKMTGKNAPWPENPSTNELLNIWKESASSFGINLVPEQRGGLSDGNYFWKLIPTLDGLGPIGANAHCSERTEDGSKDQEYVEESSFVPKALINIHAILRCLET